MQRLLLFAFLTLFAAFSLSAQALNWTADGAGYYQYEDGKIVQYQLPGLTKTTLVTADQLTPIGADKAIKPRSFTVSNDGQKLLLFANTRKVWRYHTRGDYWLLNMSNWKLQQLGKGLPESSLMFAKLSPDGAKAAYVSQRNVYVEDLATGKIKQLTETNGQPKLINGTFDWVYEEEFDCRDGFRWSPDGQSIAYWQIDAGSIRDFLMINNTDSIYSRTVPVEYPKVGEMPSPYRIGVVNVKSGKTVWMKIPGDPRQTYLPRMEWAANGGQLLAQQLNRKQNETQLLSIDAKTGVATTIYTEKDEAWIDLKGGPMNNYFDYISEGRELIWTSEKDGWRHLWRMDRNGQNMRVITPGQYDVIAIERIDERSGVVYFSASPDNATQRYLYSVKLDGGEAKRVTPINQTGLHSYAISPNGRYARHSFNSHTTDRMTEWVQLPDHKATDEKNAISAKYDPKAPDTSGVEFFQVTTVDGVTMDGWLRKPANFDPKKRYPILFYVYTEPAGATVVDGFGVADGGLYVGDIAADGYIYASLDGRGTPAPKGRAWRKAIYRNIGRVNIRDQAMGAKAMFERWSWIDTSRVAIWGWSGGGSTTLNCMFQYPDIYKTGISVAAVANQLTYDNIYQERYMGLPQENRDDFVQGSPITHAKNLRGNLLYIHGTGDDNVHYQNAEMLINELIKHGKQFEMMAYPNRTHNISEGDGTTEHLQALFTRFLREHCPPGGRM